MVLNVGYGLDVCPCKLATVENEIESALRVVRSEEGMCAYHGAVGQDGGRVAHPRTPIVSVAGIAGIDTSLAVTYWELNPDVTRTGNFWIGLLRGLKLKPSNGIPGTAGSGR
jgi:hypothetical protein